MAKKHQFKIADFKQWINEQLNKTDKDINDDVKKGLCLALEHVLKACEWHPEFTYNYWRAQGYIEWMQAGQPESDLKKKFILGPSEQEYNRRYE